MLLVFTCYHIKSLFAIIRLSFCFWVLGVCWRYSTLHLHLNFFCCFVCGSNCAPHSTVAPTNPHVLCANIGAFRAAMRIVASIVMCRNHRLPFFAHTQTCLCTFSVRIYACMYAHVNVCILHGCVHFTCACPARKDTAVSTSRSCGNQGWQFIARIHDSKSPPINTIQAGCALQHSWPGAAHFCFCGFWKFDQCSWGSPPS